MSKVEHLARIGIRSWDLPLARPLRVGGETLTRRTGLLVVVEDADGHAGIGEVAPLPGLHRENFVEASAQVIALAASLKGATVPEGCAALDGAFESWLGGRGLFPSVRSGIEGAVLTLLADRAGTDLAHLLADVPDDTVRVNGLLNGKADEVIAAAGRLAGKGYTALKIKVGRRDATEEAELVRAVRNRIGDGVALRLDANRAWDLTAALTFADGVRSARPAYIEEPLRDPGELQAFVERAGVPVALDETLAGCSPACPPPLRGVAALVLKIPVLGGFERAMLWARLARRECLDAVVSAAFPSAVGLSLDAAFAAALATGGSHGLDTAAAFAGDLARAPLPLSGGIIDVADISFRPGGFALERTRVLR